MAGLLIKQLPRELQRKLEERAAANRRSVTGEAIAILENALSDCSDPLTLEQIDSVRAHGPRLLRQAILDRARRRHR